jgi:hypothetical protein
MSHVHLLLGQLPVIQPELAYPVRPIQTSCEPDRSALNQANSATRSKQRLWALKALRQLWSGGASAWFTVSMSSNRHRLL